MPLRWGAGTVHGMWVASAGWEAQIRWQVQQSPQLELAFRLRWLLVPPPSINVIVDRLPTALFPEDVQHVYWVIRADVLHLD